MDRQPFTDERVDALAEQTLRELRIIGARYAKGLLTDWECEIDMTEALDRGFWVFLRDCGIRLRPDRGSYGAFAEAYRAFRSGADFGEAPQTPWLFFDAEGQTRAATAEEIRRFFRLMSRYGMTCEFFEPIPDDVPDPRRRFVHSWHGVSAYSIGFNCADDGGLLTEAQPVGKTFRLTDDRGLTATVTIKEDRRSGDRYGMDFDEMITVTDQGPSLLKAEFLAEGAIEGFTAEARDGCREILIRIGRDGRISELAYYEMRADFDVYRAFPLWRPYFRWADEKEGVRMAWFEQFKHGAV